MSSHKWPDLPRTARLEQSSGGAFIERRAWLGALGTVLLGGWTLGCDTAPRAQFGSGLSQVPTTPEITKLEHEMFELLNRDRRSAGLGPLLYDEQLANVARYQSADMRDHHFFDHHSPTSGSPDDRLDAAGYLFLTARENLSEAPNVSTSQAGLMKSPHHHENIMAQDVTHVGIGIVRGGVVDARNLMFTQLFARPGKQESELEVQAALSRTIAKARRAAGLPALKDNTQLATLAREHIAEVDSANFDQSIAAIGHQIPEQLNTAPIKGVAAVLVSSQLLPDSSAFGVPEPLLGARANSLGLAVRRVTGSKQRPTWCVLLLVGLKD